MINSTVSFYPLVEDPYMQVTNTHILRLTPLICLFLFSADTDSMTNFPVRGCVAMRTCSTDPIFATESVATETGEGLDNQSHTIHCWSLHCRARLLVQTCWVTCMQWVWVSVTTCSCCWGSASSSSQRNARWSHLWSSRASQVSSSNVRELQWHWICIQCRLHYILSSVAKHFLASAVSVSIEVIGEW